MGRIQPHRTRATRDDVDCDAEVLAYAASNPEEDFAESFFAYVFRIDRTTIQPVEKLDWIGRQPGLAEFRARAVAADLGPAEFRFDPCG